MLPARYGATPPPKISPAPTTMPIADEISPRGADSVAIGPVISAMLPRQKNEHRNNGTKSPTTLAPTFPNHHTVSAADTKPKIASGLRPKKSESPGQPNWPKNPPKPIADVTTPICVAVRPTAFTR